VFALMASRLEPGGILAINVESYGWEGPVIKAVAATLREHFREVLALPTAVSREDLGNVVLFASNSRLALRPLPEGGRQGRVDCDSYYWNRSANLAWNRRFAPDGRGAPVLTDDLNPVDLWSERTNLAAREDLHRYFGRLGLSSY
jgi:hypothetical protein